MKPARGVPEGHVVWSNYGYGYEARLSRRGRPFARLRRLAQETGPRWELVWLYGPACWRPTRAKVAVALERSVEAYAKHHAAHIRRQMPPDPYRVPRDDDWEALFRADEVDYEATVRPVGPVRSVRPVRSPGSSRSSRPS
ncbi:hypothetical protein [Luteibacter sp. 3190]|uniref:hypothetical protein n=1 Tax=Luteibacter sp. 3190 TaxID=2817736 RepID=UPI00285CAD6B|nr:hypothetical protein [Luteibacter sp. 3190]MDR6935300.1 hypothetical protein [Luteibacter sp. 3190]